MRIGIAGLLGMAALAGVAQHSAAAEYDCVTEPSRTVDVRAAVEGRIDAITVDRGDAVTAGQVLIRLDAGLEQANVELARFRSTMQGAIRSAESRLAFAELKAGRNEQLHEEKFVSAQDRDEALTERQLAEAELLEVRDNQRLAELEFRRAEEQLRLRTVVSPVDGIVTERNMSPGELADTGDSNQPILKVANISVLHVEALLPLEAYDTVAPGLEAWVMPEEPVGGRHRASVAVVDRVVDPASGTFGVRLTLPNPDGRIPAGLKCVVAFDAGGLDETDAAAGAE
jgi:RND family efflux transporter MFP subunit